MRTSANRANGATSGDVEYWLMRKIPNRPALPTVIVAAVNSDNLRRYEF